MPCLSKTEIEWWRPIQKTVIEQSIEYSKPTQLLGLGDGLGTLLAVSPNLKRIEVVASPILSVSIATTFETAAQKHLPYFLTLFKESYATPYHDFSKSDITKVVLKFLSKSLAISPRRESFCREKEEKQADLCAFKEATGLLDTDCFLSSFYVSPEMIEELWKLSMNSFAKAYRATSNEENSAISQPGQVEELLNPQQYQLQNSSIIQASFKDIGELSKFLEEKYENDWKSIFLYLRFLRMLEMVRLSYSFKDSLPQGDNTPDYQELIASIPGLVNRFYSVPQAYLHDLELCGPFQEIEEAVCSKFFKHIFHIKSQNELKNVVNSLTRSIHNHPQSKPFQALKRIIYDLNISLDEFIISVLRNPEYSSDLPLYKIIELEESQRSEKAMQKLLEEESEREKRKGREKKSQIANTNKLSSKQIASTGKKEPSQEKKNQNQSKTVTKEKTVYPAQVFSTGVTKDGGWKFVPYASQREKGSQKVNFKSLGHYPLMQIDPRVSRWIDASESKVKGFKDITSSGLARYQMLSKDSILDQVVRHNPRPILGLLTDKSFKEFYLKRNARGFLGFAMLSTQNNLEETEFITPVSIGIGDKGILYHFFIHKKDELKEILNSRKPAFEQLIKTSFVEDPSPTSPLSTPATGSSSDIQYSEIAQPNSLPVIRVKYFLDHPSVQNQQVDCTVDFYPLTTPPSKRVSTKSLHESV